MAVSSDPQTRIDENVIDDPELLELLDKRSSANAAKAEAGKRFEEADANAKTKIAELDLEEGAVVRIGTYRISKTVPGEERDVSFTVNPKSRISIRSLEA